MAEETLMLLLVFLLGIASCTETLLFDTLNDTIKIESGDFDDWVAYDLETKKESSLSFQNLLNGGDIFTWVGPIKNEELEWGFKVVSFYQLLRIEFSLSIRNTWKLTSVNLELTVFEDDTETNALFDSTIFSKRFYLKKFFENPIQDQNTIEYKSEEDGTFITNSSYIFNPSSLEIGVNYFYKLRFFADSYKEFSDATKTPDWYLRDVRVYKLTKCKDASLFNNGIGRCVDFCPIDDLVDDNLESTCQAVCDGDCMTCKGSDEPTTCTSCFQGYFLNSATSVCNIFAAFVGHKGTIPLGN